MKEQDFIEYVKPILKSKGFKKVRQRWLKDTGDFTISFLIQGSEHEKDKFYIRPGVYINLLNNIKKNYYGDFYCDITSSANPLFEFEDFYTKFTNKDYIKGKYFEFKEWEKRNPLEKRRAGLVDYIKDPVPSSEFLGITRQVAKHILDIF